MIIDVYATILGGEYSERIIANFGFLLNGLIVFLLLGNVGCLLFRMITQKLLKAKLKFKKYRNKCMGKKQSDKGDKREDVNHEEPAKE